MSGKIRFGVIGTARIAVHKVIPAMQQSDLCQVQAIASRDADRAARVATDLGVEQSFGSYATLLADPTIDAVYNPLPNHLHVPFTRQALAAGKHVLCEKPIALNLAEAEELLAESGRYPQLKVMEAFMYRHHPQWQKARQLVHDGSIGRLRSIQSFFAYYQDDPKDIRHCPSWGGGGLMDIGCYPISLSRFLFADEPQRVWSWMENDPRFGVDRLTSAMMEFTEGISTFTCSTQLVPYQRVNIFGTAGRIEIEIPFNAPSDRPCQIWLETEHNLQQITFPICDQYTIQGDLFARAILDDTPVPTPLEDAVANMRVIERIRRSADAQVELTA